MSTEKKIIWSKIILGVLILLGFLGAMSNAALGTQNSSGGGAAVVAGRLVGFVLFFVLAIWLIWSGVKGR
jgi:hypothetical protein